MAGAASAHQAAGASRERNGQQRAGYTRRTSADPQRAQQGATATAAAASPALDSLSRLQQLAVASPQVAQLRRLQALADASPQVAQLRRLQALADGQISPVAQLAGGPEEEELLQGKFATVQLQLQQAPRANNTGMPDQLKSGIESLSGLSMDHVRVHYNSSQPAQLNALAYAQGSDIHLAPGQERHLPHEAWHVVQQAQGLVRPTLQMKDGVPVNNDVGLEREADVMGEKASQYEGGVCNPSADTSMGADAGELRQQRPYPGMEASIVQRKVGSKPKRRSSDKFIRSWKDEDGDKYRLTEHNDKGNWTRVWTLEVFNKNDDTKLEGNISIYFKPTVLKPDGLEVAKESRGSGYGAKLGREALNVMTSEYMKEQTVEATQIQLDLVNPLSAHITLKQLTIALNKGDDMQDPDACRTAATAAEKFSKKRVYDPREFNKFWGRLVYLVNNNGVSVKCSGFGANVKDFVDEKTIENVQVEQLVKTMVNANPPFGFVMNIVAPRSK